jgi:hypothetical protein
MMMAKPIQARILLEKKDYIRAFRGFYTRQFGNQVFIFFLLLLIIIGIIGIARSGMQPAILVMVVLALIGLLYPYFITPLIIGSKLDKNQGLLRESVWTFTDKEILVKAEGKESRLDWSAIHEFIETKDYFLLVHSGNKRIFQVVPKRAFESTEVEKRFRELLGTKFATDVTSFVARHRLTILLVVFVVAANLIVFYLLGRSN